METKEELWGCFSWVDIDAPKSSTSLDALKQKAVAALNDKVFAERQKMCREALIKLNDLKEINMAA